MQTDLPNVNYKLIHVNEVKNKERAMLFMLFFCSLYGGGGGVKFSQRLILIHIQAMHKVVL